MSTKYGTGSGGDKYGGSGGDGKKPNDNKTPSGSSSSAPVKDKSYFDKKLKDVKDDFLKNASASQIRELERAVDKQLDKCKKENKK
jgi:hypothetical protein